MYDVFILPLPFAPQYWKKKAAISESENRKIKKMNETIIICLSINFLWLKMWKKKRL